MEKYQSEFFGHDHQAITAGLKTKRQKSNGSFVKLTQAQRQEIAAAYQRGVRAVKLADTYSVSTFTIYDSLRKQGISGRRLKRPAATARRLTEDEVNLIYDLWDANMSVAKIAKNTGISETAITYRLRRRPVVHQFTIPKPPTLWQRIKSWFI